MQVSKYIEKNVRAYFDNGVWDEGSMMEKMVRRMVDERLKSVGK